MPDFSGSTTHDWKAYVRAYLADLHINSAREQEIVTELAQHVEQVYNDAIAGRLSDADALRQVEVRFANWPELARQIESEEPPPLPETRPGLFAGTLDELRHTFRL